MGYDRSDYAGKPVIAIINTWSDINPCHAHFKQRVEEVKRGVWEAGGFPVEARGFPNIAEGDEHLGGRGELNLAGNAFYATDSPPTLMFTPDTIAAPP
jgi:hypothetical protein